MRGRPPDEAEAGQQPWDQAGQNINEERDGRTQGKNLNTKSLPQTLPDIQGRSKHDQIGMSLKATRTDAVGQACAAAMSQHFLQVSAIDPRLEFPESS